MSGLTGVHPRLAGMALLLVLMSVLMPPVLAAIDVYEFADAGDVERFNSLIEELRCPQCLNTNLAGSDAPISADLRRTVATMIQEGHSDQEIRDFLHDRYGDFILYRPRLTLGTALLWFGPALLVLVGGVVAWRMARRGAADPTLALDAAERAQLDELRAEYAEAGTPPRT